MYIYSGRHKTKIKFIQKEEPDQISQPNEMSFTASRFLALPLRTQ